MEIVKILWIFVFFLFSFCLIFIWSKMYVVMKRIEALTDLVRKNQAIDDEFLKMPDIEQKAEPALKKK